MNRVLKRLELVVASIELDEEEIIKMQIAKLKELPLDAKAMAIVYKLESLDYSGAVVEIKEYLKRYSGLELYIDSEVEGLKLELKALEQKIQNLTELKNEYLNKIEEFNIAYSLKLGAIIEKILKLKEQILQETLLKKEQILQKEKKKLKELKEEYVELNKKKREIEDELSKLDELDDEFEELYKEYQEVKEEVEQKEQELFEQREKAKKAKEELEDDPQYQEYEEVKNDYKEFKQEYEEVKTKEENRCHLSKDEEKELKKLYRKASRMCHPDIVEDSLRDQAQELMKELNEAYSNKNIQKVEEILFSLQSGVSFVVASDIIDDKEILKSKIEELRAKIEVIEDEIESIKTDETYILLEEIDNLDDYLEDLKKSLESEYEELLIKKESLNSANSSSDIDNLVQSLEESEINKKTKNDDFDEFWYEEF